MDVGAPADWSLEAVVPGEEILRRIRTRHELTPLPRRSPSDVASRYALRDGGEIGLVAAVTQPFCEACVRARIAADGRLHTCLFGPGGYNVLEALRSGQPDRAVAERVAAIWRARTAAFCMNHDRLREERAEMYQIGG
jgi:cyclic pyranopterin phosphate synthase